MSEQSDRLRGVLRSLDLWIFLKQRRSECPGADMKRKDSLLQSIRVTEADIEMDLREYVLAVVREEPANAQD